MFSSKARSFLLSLAETAAFALLIVYNSGTAATSEGNVGVLNAVSHDLNRGALPAYDFAIQDGLYATVTALRSIKEKDLKVESEVRLGNIEGFGKDLKVRVLWQEKEAPLVVLLLGLATTADSPLARLFKANMYKAGCHVLTFDSVFLPSFNARSGHGVAGNVEVEAQLIAKIVEAFLKKNDAKKKITKLGMVGASYGGILSLQISKLVRQNKIQLPLEAVLAFSPPIRIQTAARLLDKYHAEDRWQFTLMELGDDLLSHDPVPPGEPIPFSQSEMRAGIAAAFRSDLMEVIEQNDRYYRLLKLPKPDSLGDDQYRRDVAETWTFTRFIEEMSYPYWKEQGKATTPDMLWAAGNIETLLPDCPIYAHVIIASDDPLNSKEDVDALRGSAPQGMLTVLPTGGHLGYIHTDWAKARMQSLFE